jgi:HEAT repeat protein
MKDITDLIKELEHKDSSVRQNAAQALGRIGGEEAVDALIPVLKDKNRFVRQEAIAALGKIGGANLVEPLTHALKEEKDEFVKDSIKKVLEKMQSGENAK